MCADLYSYILFIIILIIQYAVIKCETFVVRSSIEKDFLDSLPLSQQCTEEEEELLHFLFENKLKKVNWLCISLEY